MIEATVGLPLYRGQHIAWLALESLCKQRTTIEWELIIAEELGNDEFGKEKVYSYAGRLGKANCKRIIYSGLKKWVPLSDKIVLLIRKASPTSKVFIYQGADNYSKSTRVQESYDLIVNHRNDYITSQIGAMYNIYTEQVFIYDVRKLYDSTKLTTGWDQAFSIDLLKKLKSIGKKEGIDKWLTEAAKEAKLGSPLKFFYNNHPSWNEGFHTHGINNITLHRFLRKVHKLRYNAPKKYKYDFKKQVPLEIVDKLKTIKNYCRCGKEIPSWLGR